MYKTVEGNPLGYADVGKFIALINEPPAGLRDLFDPRADIFLTRAPGRLDVMGGIADYSGSLVLQMPIAEATLAAIQKSDDGRIVIVSLHRGATRYSTFEMTLADLANNREPADYESIRNFFLRSGSKSWARYTAGIFFVLRRELGIDFRAGARILIRSRVPVGKGVSSSAALEVAVMQAVCAAYEIEIEPRELAMLCQRVENSIASAACGVMDQITAHCGVKNALVSLLCQPAEIGEPLKIPDEIELWGIDSGVRHAVAGSDYASVRVGAFMGYRIIAHLAGLGVAHVGDGLVAVDDQRWNGYLANVSPEEYEREFLSRIPTAMSGREFLASYGGTTDAVTTIEAERMYAVRSPTEHAIYEATRVRTCAKLLSGALGDDDLETLGGLMFESHKSYAACGLTESRTDRIVELVRERRDDGLYGARITGGGSGGTVAVLAHRGSRPAISKLAERFGAESGKKPYIFHGSSPGCATFGYLRLTPA